MSEFLNIDESKVKIEGKAWDSDELRGLATKKVFQFQKCVAYWEPLLRRGAELTDRFEGNIFTPEQRAEYVSKGVIPLEPPIAKAPIRALAGHVIKSRRSGQVVSERSSMEAGDNTKELEVINAVMKDMETKSREDYYVTEAIKSAFVTGYWNVLMFDRERPSRNSDGIRYRMRPLPWNSCVFGPTTIREPDGSDIKEMFYFDYRNVADLLDNYPDMEKQIKEHFDVDAHVDNRMLSSLKQWEDSMTSDDRDMMYDVLRSADELGMRSGMAKVVMHLFPVKRQEEVWVNMYDSEGEDIEIRPPEWDDERWGKWVQDNSGKYAGPYYKEVITLWTTVFTLSGLVLANERHWYQENGMLPCSFWLGQMSNNQPTGPMVDLNAFVLAVAVAETESLHEQRMQSSQLITAREGDITNIEDLAEEATKPTGIAMISQSSNRPVSDSVQIITRRPNNDWQGWGETQKRLMYEVTRINEAMLGEHSARQSGTAKESEISQALTVNAVYIDNMNRSWEYHQNLKLKLIPYFYDQWEVLEVIDEETGERQSLEVNAPAEYDADGNILTIINDLASSRHRWQIHYNDDSANAKMQAVEEAVNIVNATAGPLAQADPTGAMFFNFLMSLDNPLLKTSGKNMSESAQQSAQQQQAQEQQKLQMEQVVKLINARAALQRAHKSGVFLNFRAEDLSNYPGLLELFAEIQKVSSDNVEQDFQAAQQAAVSQAPDAGMPGMAVPPQEAAAV